MKTNIFDIVSKISLVAATVVVATACSLEEDMKSNYSPSAFYRNAAECKAGLNGCYIPQRSIFNGTYMLVTEAPSDIMYINSGTYDAILDISPANPRFGNTMWNNGYLGVMRSNNILAAIERVDEPDSEKVPLYTEGLILRAFFYYVLTCNFGDVPFYDDEIVTTEDQLRIAKLPRMSAVDTRRFCFNQLEEWLPNAYNEQVMTFRDKTDYRMGVAVGYMVAAKMAMWNACAERLNPDAQTFKKEHPYHKPYEGSEYWWRKALDMLDHLEEIYGDLEQYPVEDIIFRKKFTRESIWENSNFYDEQGLNVTINVAGFYTPTRQGSEGSDAGFGRDAIYDGLEIPMMGAYMRTYTAFRPNTYFYQQLQPYTNRNDKRQFINMAWGWDVNADTADPESAGFKFFKSPKDAQGRPWMGRKFWCPGMRNTSDSNNHRIFRYAGAVLMQAECWLMLGNKEKSAQYLNKVRARAGLGPVSPSNYRNTAAFLAEIQKECGRELIGEFQRKHELVRWGIFYNSVLDHNDLQKVRDNILPCHEYYPIPDRQVSYSGGALDNNAYAQYGM